MSIWGTATVFRIPSIPHVMYTYTEVAYTFTSKQVETRVEQSQLLSVNMFQKVHVSLRVSKGMYFVFSRSLRVYV